MQRQRALWREEEEANAVRAVLYLACWFHFMAVRCTAWANLLSFRRIFFCDDGSNQSKGAAQEGIFLWLECNTDNTSFVAPLRSYNGTYACFDRKESYDRVAGCCLSHDSSVRFLTPLSQRCIQKTITTLMWREVDVPRKVWQSSARMRSAGLLPI